MHDSTPDEARTFKYKLIYYPLFILLVQLCLAFVTYQILKNEYANDREQCITETKFEEALWKAIESGFDEEFLDYPQWKRGASSTETPLFNFLGGVSGILKVKRDLGPRPTTPGFPGPRGPPSPTDYPPGFPGSRGGHEGRSIKHW